MSSEKDGKLVFETSKFQTSYLPCSFKERFDNIATQQLLNIDENDIDFDSSNRFENAWVTAENKGETSMREEKESLGELLYEAVRLDPFTQDQRAVGPWQICDSQNGHNKGYIKELCSWKQAPSLRQQFSSRKPDKRRLSQEKQLVLSNRGPRKCDQLEEKPSDKENYVEVQAANSAKGENSRGSQIRTTPHDILKFRRFLNPREFITYYRDCITYFMIQQHLCRYVNNWQASKSFKPPIRKDTLSRNTEDKKTQIFRFKLSSEKKAFGVLRVGPCPRAENTKNVEALERTKEEKRFFRREERQRREPTRTEAFEMTITGAKPPSADLPSETSSIQRRLSKAKLSRTLVLPKSSSVDLSTIGGKEESYNNLSFGGNWNEKIKTVELQIVKAATGSRAKGTSKGTKFNRPKNKPVLPISFKTSAAKKVSPAHGSCQPSIVCDANLTNLIYSDKHFLHITTPKPIGVNPANQRGSSTKINNGTVYPWSENMNVIPRSRLIDESQILGPYARQYPDKRFQACITPRSYPSSSIDVKIQENCEETYAVGHCRSEEAIHKIAPKKSVQKVFKL